MIKQQNFLTNHNTQNQLEKCLRQIEIIHKKYFEDVVFTQIDHAPTEQFSQYFQIQEECLLINFAAFDAYYPSLMKIMAKSKEQRHVMIACDLILAMNGQNDKAWNIKKSFLVQQKLDIQKQLRFNRAVCLKCKKSSSYYEYRLRLIQDMLEKKQSILQNNKENNFEMCLRILQEENNLINLVLGRFFRNYFCWMYRIKLIKLLIKHISKQKCEDKEKSLKNVQIFIQKQDSFIHKFLEKNCNDNSGYSYLTSLVTRYGSDLNKEIEWATQMLQFCKVAYFQQSSYNRLVQYLKFIINKK